MLDASAMTMQFLLAAVKDVPEDRMTAQFGTIVNHPAWTLAHLSAYAGALLDMLDDQSVPDPQAELAKYGYGTTPVPDAAAYLPKAELLAQCTDRFARLAAVIAEKHAEYFPRPVPEKYRDFTSTIGHIAAILFLAHPAYHFGQINQWRKAAGIAAAT